MSGESSETRTRLAERGGFEPPVPRGLLWVGVRPEFGALFGPTKSIRAGENLFALGFGFASAFSGSLRSPRLNADARRRRRSDQSSGSNPSASITVTRCPSRLDGANDADGAQSDDGG